MIYTNIHNKTKQNKPTPAYCSISQFTAICRIIIPKDCNLKNLYTQINKLKIEMDDDSTEITVSEVDYVLSKIENKFSPVEDFSTSNEQLEENLVVLSKELDSIGVPTIDFSQPLPKMFENLVCSARSLVQIHRKTLAQMKDTNITSQSSHVKNNYLHKVVDNYQSKINSYENKNYSLQNRIEVLEQKVKELRTRETDIKTEMGKVKRYYTEQFNDYLKKIKKLSEENKKLKEEGLYITPQSKDDIFLTYVGRYKKNEEIYKSTIQKLEENNRQLVREIVFMKYKIEQDTS